MAPSIFPRPYNSRLVAYTALKDLKDKAGQEVTVAGWVFTKRASKKILFIELRDGTGIVQTVTAREAVGDGKFADWSALPQESSIVAVGAARLEPRAKGGVELDVKEIRIVAATDGEYPINKPDHTPDFLLERRHLWLRSKKQWALLRVRDTVFHAIHDYFRKEGFLHVSAPILTPAACEGTSTLFGMDYFDQGKAYLTQSGQLYMEAAAMAHGKVYCFGPTFRAEKSKTRRHLTEFWMVEPEAAFYELEDVMKLAEGLLCHVVQAALAERQEELAVLERDIEPLKKVVGPFPRISYTEAHKLAEKAGEPFAFGDDLGAPQEAAISRQFDRPVMIHRYPAEVKAFYMKRDPSDERFALCVDVLAPEGFGEIVGGSQREEDLAVLERRIAEHKLPKEAFEWYLDLRRFGTVPHGGFGLGLERTVAWIAGREHVRETIPFPRMLYRIYP